MAAHLLSTNILVKREATPHFLCVGVVASRQDQAFLCSGGRYLRPRSLKMSSSEVAWKNVFCKEQENQWLGPRSGFHAV